MNLKVFEKESHFLWEMALPLRLGYLWRVALPPIPLPFHLLKTKLIHL